MLQVDQGSLADNLKPLNRKEARDSKRTLSEFLQQGDFFSGAGKLGFYFQERDVVAELRMEEQPDISSFMEQSRFVERKRLRRCVDDGDYYQEQVGEMNPEMASTSEDSRVGQSFIRRLFKKRLLKIQEKVRQ